MRRITLFFVVTKMKSLSMKKISLLLLTILSAIFTYGQVKTLPLSNYIELRDGLNHVKARLIAHKKTTVAFLGGSITFNEGWRNQVCAYLQKSYPYTKFHFISAGIPSLGSLPHAFRFRQDVLDSGKIDLLFLESAVNDQVNGTDSITQVRALEGIVRHAKRKNPKTDIVMMSFADPEKTAKYNEGIVPLSVANHERIASHYGLPSINLAKAIRDKLQNKEFDWDKDFKDLHPSPFGQQLYFEAITTMLGEAFNSKNKRPVINEKPPAALDRFNFSNGRYYSITKANTDVTWSLIGDWKPEDQLGTREKFVHIPVLESNQIGASLTLGFKGTAIGMAIVSGGDAGIVSYRIDNGTEKQVDLFTPWSNSLHLPWYILFQGDLPNRQHTLTLRINADKNPSSKGNACRIVNFFLNRL